MINDYTNKKTSFLPLEVINIDHLPAVHMSAHLESKVCMFLTYATYL